MFSSISILYSYEKSKAHTKNQNSKIKTSCNEEYPRIGYSRERKRKAQISALRLERLDSSRVMDPRMCSRGRMFPGKQLLRTSSRKFFAPQAENDTALITALKRTATGRPEKRSREILRSGRRGMDLWSGIGVVSIFFYNVINFIVLFESRLVLYESFDC